MSVLTAKNRKAFYNRGYTVVEDVVDTSLIEAVIGEYEELLDSLCHRWHREGRLPSPYGEHPFFERLKKVIQESEIDYGQHFDITLPHDGREITEESPFHVGPAVFALLRAPGILDAVEPLIGPEITVSPVHRARVKLPESLVPEDRRNALNASTPWHQDQGFVLPEADATELITVWVPLVDATAENGCLTVIPGGHRVEELIEHCADGRIPNPLVELEKSRPVPVGAGDALLLHRKLPHASLPNRSEAIRWSFDLRYQPTGTPTGRPWFPGFVARSRRDPGRELRDPDVWIERWHETRRRLAREETPDFLRWREGSPLC